MQGKRVPDNTFPENPGEYSKLTNGPVEWVVCCPTGQRFHLASPQSPDSKGNYHVVDEHDDGTISVCPPGNSIMAPGERWHGHIIKGEWVPC
jgi:hypothetical protein